MTSGTGAGGTNAPAFIRVSQVFGTYIAQALPTAPTYGTTLPASPADGQEHVLVDSITSPTYQWRFRYNAGNTSAYKWEFIGGSPDLKGPQGSLTAAIPATGWTWVSGAPTWTAPRAGVYIVEYGGILQHQNAGASTLFLGLMKAGGAPVNALQQGASDVWDAGSPSHPQWLTATPADGAYSLYVQSSPSHSWASLDLWIKATPWAVA